MNKSPTNKKNHISDKCNQVADQLHATCQPLLARRMGNNISRRRTGTNTINRAAAAPATLQANALVESSTQASFVPSVAAQMTATSHGGASGSAAHCVSTAALASTHSPPPSLQSCRAFEHCAPIDNASVDACGAGIADVVHGCTGTADGGLSSHSAPALSALPATRESIDASETAGETADTKIATTKTHTAALTVARLSRSRTPTTTARAACATLAAGQLTKEKKNSASTTTLTHAMTTTATSEQALVATHSSVTRRAQSAARLTSLSHIGDVQVEGVRSAVDAKSKFSENKCPLAALTNVSNQREVEASTTIPAPEQCTLNSNNSDLNDYSERASEAHVSSNKWPAVVGLANSEHDPAFASARARTDTSSSSKDTIRALNLAARKAKLKSDFFRDFETHEQAAKRLTQAPSVISDCGPTCKTEPSQPNQSGITGLPATTKSLVARRKLDLKQKFEQKIASRTLHPLPQAQNALTDAVIAFPRVEELVQKFEGQPTSFRRKMIVQPNKSSEVADNNMLSLKPDRLEQRNSPLSDEGCNLGQSPYSSDNEDNEFAQGTAAAAQTKRKDKVARSASSDSALGLDVDESMDTTPAQPPVGPQQRRMTLTVTDLPLRPALLPLAEPTALPDTTIIELPPTINNPPAQAAVPSKVLLEERVVELPEDPRSLAPSQPCSRRESAQSCGSDTAPTEFPGGRRFVRTPSVVVSDYSDEIMCGITLEEIEYFRAQRMRRRHSSLDTANEGEGESDVSASSSCSNLYYCGSTISALDGAECYVNGVRTALDRKASDCSTCSASAEEESFTIPEDPPQTGKDLSDLLAAQHLSTKPAAKKVGLVVPMGENLGEKAPY